MKKETKKRVQRIVGLSAAALVVLGLAIMPLVAKNAPKTDGPQASILSGTVKSRELQQTLLGGGTLSQQAAEPVTVPEAVKLTGLLKKNGDAVAAGEGIATVDRVSVMEAISQVQETLRYYSEEIEAAGGSAESQKITAKAGGTVKAVYAAVGDPVEAVMLEQGALAVLSLDGRMSVTFQTEAALSGGAEVTVVLADGTAVAGTVESSLQGTVKVLLTDEGYTPGQQVTVLEQEAEVGTGTLEINSPWKVTAYAGTVSSVAVKAGDTVAAGDLLLKLSDTGNSATWQQLVDQRTQYEELMLELFQMYQTGLLTAPCDGVVSGLDESGSQMLQLSQLAGAPNGDDETLYINYIGRVAAVGQNGWAVLRNPIPVVVEDYRQLTGLDLDAAHMTEVAVYQSAEPAAPLYEWEENQWVQADLTTVRAEDVILFAGDSEGNFVWLVRVKKAENQQEQPSGDQQRPGQQTQMPSNSGSSRPQQQEEEEAFAPYSLTTVEVASVTAQQKMTLQIQVDEQDILKLQPGQTASVTVDALTGQIFTGTITDVGSTGTNSGGSSKFPVELTMERAEGMLAGMHATATVALDTAQTVLSVPVAALTEQENKTVLYTGYDEKTQTLTNPVEVTLGLSDGETVELLSGLGEGDTYYYSYYDTLEISNTPDFSGSQFFGR